MTKLGKYTRFKNYAKKLKSSFIIYKDFESVLVLAVDGKQNLDNLYTNYY